jgi:hypothetical protein
MKRTVGLYTMDQKTVDDYFRRQYAGAQAMIPSWERDALKRAGAQAAPPLTRGEHWFFAKHNLRIALQHLTGIVKPR